MPPATPSSSATITEANVSADLARLPPPLPRPKPSSSSSSSSSPFSELALVLLHQQCCSLLRMQQRKEDESPPPIKEQLARVRAELSRSQPRQQQGVHHEKAGNPGFRMADALEDEGEEEDSVDKEMYLRVLWDHTALPVTVRLHRPGFMNTSASSAAAVRDGSEHQSMRDVERDQLCLDGTLYKAGLGGYSRVLQWLRGAMEARLQECLAGAKAGVGEQVLLSWGGGDQGGGGGGGGGGKLEAFAKEMLRRINRTHSAGVAYDRLSHAFGVDGVTNIVPDSAAGA
jgi:hypothetical protein